MASLQKRSKTAPCVQMDWLGKFGNMFMNDKMAPPYKRVPNCNCILAFFSLCAYHYGMHYMLLKK